MEEIMPEKKSRVIIFKETDRFYERLDSMVKKGPVLVKVRSEKPDLNSKLWKRLRACSNGKEIEVELKKLARGDDSYLSGMASASLVSIPMMMLIAWLAALVFGLGAYAIYKDRTVKISAKGDGAGGGVDVNIE